MPLLFSISLFLPSLNNVSHFPVSKETHLLVTLHASEVTCLGLTPDCALCSAQSRTRQ